MEKILRASVLIAAVVCATVTVARGQTTKEIVGTWSVVSAVEDKAGKKTDFFGPNPHAMMMLDDNGHFMQIIMRDDLPKIAANARASATEQEAKAVLQGSTAYYGTYKVAGGGKLTFNVERSIFANWNGMEQHRTFMINGDELTMSNPANFGAGNVQSVWKRVK